MCKIIILGTLGCTEASRRGLPRQMARDILVRHDGSLARHHNFHSRRRWCCRSNIQEELVYTRIKSFCNTSNEWFTRHGQSAASLKAGESAACGPIYRWHETPFRGVSCNEETDFWFPFWMPFFRVWWLWRQRRYQQTQQVLQTSSSNWARESWELPRHSTVQPCAAIADVIT